MLGSVSMYLRVADSIVVAAMAPRGRWIELVIQGLTTRERRGSEDYGCTRPSTRAVSATFLDLPIINCSPLRQWTPLLREEGAENLAIIFIARGCRSVSTYGLHLRRHARYCSASCPHAYISRQSPPTARLPRPAGTILHVPRE